MVTIFYSWNGMSCKICTRRNADGICDFHGKQDAHNFCEDFQPHGVGLSKDKILYMWGSIWQRFIRERREINGGNPN